MSVYIQMSGFDKNGFYESVAAELRKEIHDTESIVFVASDPENFAKNDDHWQRICRWLEEAGICFKTRRVIDARASAERQKQWMRDASCVFLMGGQTRRQLDYLKAREMITIMRRHEGVVIGLSAGAINMSKRSVVANPLYPPTSVHCGMGLVGTTVVPHFDAMSEAFVKTDITPLTYEGAIYCLCDDAVIVTRDDGIRHGGTIYRLSEGVMRALTDKDILRDMI